MPLDTALRAALSSAGLADRSALFIEEELTHALLVDMAGNLCSNLEEIGLSKEEAARLASILQQPAQRPNLQLAAFPSWTDCAPAQFHAQCKACSDSAAVSKLPVDISSEAAAPSSPPASSGFAARVAALQGEFFAEDLHPPDGAEHWSEDQLVAFFESGGDQQEAGGGSDPWSVAPSWSIGASAVSRPLSNAAQWGAGRALSLRLLPTCTTIFIVFVF